MAQPTSDIDEQSVSLLIRDLTEATEQTQLRWRDTTSDGTSLLLEGADGSVRIRTHGDGSHPFSFDIFNSDGKKIFSVVTSHGNWYTAEEEALAALYVAAYRSVYDIPGTVAGLRAEWGLGGPEAP